MFIIITYYNNLGMKATSPIPNGNIVWYRASHAATEPLMPVQSLPCRYRASVSLTYETVASVYKYIYMALHYRHSHRTLLLHTCGALGLHPTGAILKTGLNKFIAWHQHNIHRQNNCTNTENNCTFYNNNWFQIPVTRIYRAWLLQCALQKLFMKIYTSGSKHTQFTLQFVLANLNCLIFWTPPLQHLYLWI